MELELEWCRGVGIDNFDNSEVNSEVKQPGEGGNDQIHTALQQQLGSVPQSS